jgi:hypothetical protein
VPDEHDVREVEFDADLQYVVDVRARGEII